MKINRHARLVTVIAISILLLAPLLRAQTSSNELSNVLTNSSTATRAEASVADSNTPSATSTNDTGSEQSWSARSIVLTGQNAELKAGETALDVVVMGGTAVIHGKVLHNAVVIWGQLDVDGEIGQDCVTVMGSVHLRPGAVVHNNAVAVLGNLNVDERAKVGRDAVSVMGRLTASQEATIGGQRVNVGAGFGFPSFEPLNKWLKYCVFELRPLAPQVGWVWVIAGFWFILSLFVAAVFPRPVEVCVETMTRRPATTFLMGLLTKLVAPIVIIILAITGIGLVVVPFVVVALAIGALVGKIAIREWIGFRIGKHFGNGIHHPLLAFLIGTIIVTILYMIPVIGFLTLVLLSIWGLGCAVTAMFSSFRRETPQNPSPQPPGPGSPNATMGAASMPLAPARGPEPAAPQNVTAEPPPGATSIAGLVTATMPAPPPVHPAALNYPRAGFWERMAAGLLDIVVVGVLSVFVHVFPLGFAVALAYFAGMWAWKGTTIGGIVLKLQVVRSDGGPLTFPVALVRALTSVLSLLVFFLGFLWIIWDRDKQAWHDKIAGTEVVLLPRSLPLVCI
jgi:uncharacterized RDD family membrane protein YckC